jgi:hypothetical protein
MRRGLKCVMDSLNARNAARSFKPIPDEEGTEIDQARLALLGGGCFKPIPDEEGTEMRNGLSQRSKCRSQLQTDPR